MLFLVLLHKNNWYLQQESNLYQRLRRSPFYPLNYGDMEEEGGVEPPPTYASGLLSKQV
jgi:hypothetical protein